MKYVLSFSWEGNPLIYPNSSIPPAEQWELNQDTTIKRVTEMGTKKTLIVVNKSSLRLILLLSQAQNIHKPRARTNGNLEKSKTSSGNPNLIDSFQEAITIYCT